MPGVSAREAPARGRPDRRARRAVLVLVAAVSVGVLAACTDRTESVSSSGLTNSRSNRTTTTPPRTPTSSVLPATRALPVLTDGTRWKPVLDDGFGGSALDAVRTGRRVTTGRPTTCTNASTHELELYTPTERQRSRRRVAAHGPPRGGDRRRRAGTSTTRPGWSPSAGPIARCSRSATATSRPAPASRPARASWSAFWLLPDEPHVLPEVDVFEIVGYQAERRPRVHALAGRDRQAAVCATRDALAAPVGAMARLRPRLGAVFAHVVRRRAQGVDDGLRGRPCRRPT